MEPSIIAILRGQDWWQAFDSRPVIFEQKFGDHLRNTDVIEESYADGQTKVRLTRRCYVQSGESTFWNTDELFKVRMVVNKFKLEELEVKVVGRFIIIHGKHEEREDDHGFASREFTRRYMLPNTCDRQTVSATFFSYDDCDSARLYVIAKKSQSSPKPVDRLVPFEMVGGPCVSDSSSSGEGAP